MTTQQTVIEQAFDSREFGDEVIAAVDAAEAASEEWAATAPRERAEILRQMGARHLHVGPRGQGATFKLVVNALFATQVAVLSELLHLADAQGLAADRVHALLAPLPVISPAAAGVLGQMVAGDHAPRFPVDLVAKDLGYAAGAGAGEVVRAARAAFSAASAAGHGDLHLSAVHLG